MVSRISRCLAELSTVHVLLSGLASSQRPLQDVLSIRDELTSLLDEHGIYDCKLYNRVNQSPLPDTAVSIDVVRQYFRPILLEMFQACLCSALLPTCPPPAEDNCVPLATLTINCKGGGCHITRVCNWENRRLAIGFPTLEYWFEALIAQSGIAGALEKLCCEPVRVRTPPNDLGIVGGGIARADVAVNPNANPETAVPVDDLLTNLLDEAVNDQGSVKRSSVYRQIGEILKDLLEKLFSDK
jgi:hypothetical protein